MRNPFGRASLALVAAALAPSLLYACASDGVANTADDAGGPGPALLESGTSDTAPAEDVHVDSDAPIDSPCRAEDDWCETTLPLTGAAVDAGTGTEPTADTLTLTSVLTKSDTEAWAVSAEGFIVRWDGTRWKIDATTGSALTAIAGDETGTLWAVGGQGAILRRLPNGATWDPVAYPEGTDLRAVCVGEIGAERSQNLWVMSADRISRWTGETEDDGSPRWQTKSSGDNELRSLWCSQETVLVAAQYFDTDIYQNIPVLLSNDGTSNEDANWASEPPVFTAPFELAGLDSIWATDPSHVWLGIRQKNNFIDHDYVLARSPTQSGDAWSESVAGKTDRSSDFSIHVWGRSAANVWLVLLHGRIYHWDGAKLSLSRTSKDGLVFRDELNAVSGNPGGGDVWAVGKNVALHHRTGN